MNDDRVQDLERQLQAERERVRQLEEEQARLTQQVGHLQCQVNNYKPMAEAWMHDTMPSKEECERILTEMLAHPEQLLDMDDVLRDLEQEFGKPASGESAA